MNREIKFAGEFTYRIWCSNDKKMLYTHDDVEAFARDNGETKEDVMNCVFSDTRAQRSTGLKDKNGKEIYEGDILCVLEDVVADTIDGYNRYEQEGCFMEVVFDQYGRWSIKGNSMVNGELLYDVLSEAQVIGNIDENPELIKENDRL